MIAIPSVVVFSALCSTALGLNPAGQISFSQRLLIATGLMTILQSLEGHVTLLKDLTSHFVTL
jgi:hypothetical protein